MRKITIPLHLQTHMNSVVNSGFVVVAILLAQWSDHMAAEKKTNWITSMLQEVEGREQQQPN